MIADLSLIGLSVGSKLNKLLYNHIVETSRHFKTQIMRSIEVVDLFENIYLEELNVLEKTIRVSERQITFSASEKEAYQPAATHQWDFM